MARPSAYGLGFSGNRQLFRTIARGLLPEVAIAAADILLLENTADYSWSVLRARLKNGYGETSYQVVNDLLINTQRRLGEHPIAYLCRLHTVNEGRISDQVLLSLLLKSFLVQQTLLTAKVKNATTTTEAANKVLQGEPSQLTLAQSISNAAMADRKQLIALMSQLLALQQVLSEVTRYSGGCLPPR